MPRTRSLSAHRKVLDAALDLVAERGIEATSMDAIAARSGVSKATIYKHWQDKDSLLLEMLAMVNGLKDRPLFDTGDVRADILAVLSYRPMDYAEIRERIMPQFAAYSATNVTFGQAWRHVVMEPPRKELRGLLRTGIANGELSEELDENLGIALLLGPMMYWYLFLRLTSQTSRDLALGVVDAFWRAFGKPRSRTKRQ
jgi:AcrR family transcriptional regulator